MERLRLFMFTVVGTLALLVAVPGCARSDRTDGDRSLFGTDWAVQSVTTKQGGGIAAPTGGGYTYSAYLRFDGTDGFTGSTGCVPIAGKATVTGDRITFTLADPPTCATGDPALHNALVATLQGAVNWDVEWHTLTLSGPDGTVLNLLPKN